MNKRTLLVIALTLAWAGAAAAAVVNVNFFQTDPIYSGQGAYADIGNDFWNHVNENGPVILNNSANQPTSVTISLSDSSSGYNGFADGWAQGLYAAPELFAGFIDPDAGPVVIGGLLRANTYDLYLYGGGGGVFYGEPPDETHFTIGGVTKSTLNDNAATHSFIKGTDYVVYMGLAPEADGTISITWTGNSDGAFNGLQLVSAPIPEPTSLALVGAGAMLLALRPRRA